MAEPALLDALPDLVVMVRRDGSLLSHAGGRALPGLLPQAGSEGRPMRDIWPAEVAELVGQLTRRAISHRGHVDASLRTETYQLEARASAQGPDRALCVLRALGARTQGELRANAPDTPGPQAERRGLLRRFRQSVATAQLSERPLAASYIKLDGLTDIARVIDSRLAEDVLALAVARIPAQPAGFPPDTMWYVGPLNDHALLMVVESGEREQLEPLLNTVCESLRTPVAIGDAHFSLTPYAGVALLGPDSGDANALLEQARNTAVEARRAGNRPLRFYSDTVRVRSLARLDLAEQLAAAIRQRALRLRYVGRHDLVTGQRVACVAYLRWEQALGEMRPQEFLAVAETAGLSVSLSRAMFECLAEDRARLQPQLGAGMRLSIGALRHHLLRPDFCAEMLSFIRDARVPAEQLELRIAERTFLSLEPTRLRALSDAGVQLIVDEVGRDLGSLDRLASAPLAGLQLDRSWVTSLPHDERAMRVCRAGLGVAAALQLVPIAMGVDHAEQRGALLALGCRQGLGDLYRGEMPAI